MAKPLKFHQTLNQAPRSIKHGQHRRASPPAHSHSVGEPSDSAGGSDQSRTVTISWSTINTITSFDTGAFFTEPKPPTIPYAGIRTGELIGHRLWWVIDGQLCSLAHRQLWKPNETIGGNTKKPATHDWMFSPRTIWGGVYSFFSADQLLAEVMEFQAEIAKWSAHTRLSRVLLVTSDWVPYEETSTLVSGTIKMWGDVVEHERGYRAEFAKLNSIDEMYGPGDIKALRHRYFSLTAGEGE